MIDREKVIKGLDVCANGNGCKDGIPNPLCPYSSEVGCDLNQILLDALFLLKEQEAVKIHITDDFGSIKFGHCPNCGATINSKAFQKSCGCGQAVKWE